LRHRGTVCGSRTWLAVLKTNRFRILGGSLSQSEAAVATERDRGIAAPVDEHEHLAAQRLELNQTPRGGRQAIKSAPEIKIGRLAEARTEFERAAALTRNARERELLLGRAAASIKA